jgi:hypothetical protein
VFLVRSLVDLLGLDKGNATGPSLGRYCSRGFSHAAPAAQHYKAVGRIFKAAASRVDYREDRTPTHGYDPTREAAMAA